MPIYKKGKPKDGKQCYTVRVNYTDSNGEYRTKTKTVFGMAEAKLVEQELLKDVKENKSPSKHTVQSLFEEYIEAKRAETRQTTLEKTIRILEHDVLPTMGKCKLDKLTKPLLQEWKNGIYDKPLHIRTKKNIFSEFRAMLNFAVKMDYLNQNPLVKLGNFKDTNFETPQDKLHYYTPEQFKQFIAVAKAHDATMSDRGYYLFFAIAFYTGMRKGEINALKWSDIEGNIVHIRRSVAQKVKGKSIVETPPKNKSSYRDVQMPKPLIDILSEHKEQQKKSPDFSEDFRVCGGISCLSDTAISNKNNQYAEEAGLPHIRIHDFRHSHATLLANEGINIQEIARRLGHSDIKMTWNTYAHLYPREEERAIRVLESL